MATRIQDIEQRLWQAADELRANSKLSSHDYSVPVLGLIFLRYADHRFRQAQEQLEAEQAAGRSRRRGIGDSDYQAMGVMVVPDEARYANLLALPEGANIGMAVNDAMRAIEARNPDLEGVLPKTYNRLSDDVLVNLLKHFNSVPMDIEGDAFGRIYEYFLAQFAMGEGRRGGEFFTPTSIVRLIVEIIEPYHGRILDPACGSGGMFVQSARFVESHQNPVPVTSEVTGTSKAAGTLSIYGQERVSQTIRLAQMNLAVHGLAGDIRQANSYYEDAHNSVGKFDFVMANPPFNVNNVDKERLKGDPRFPLGLPRVDNANYLWIQLFYSALNDEGRAGFVMANSAADARHSEQEIRRKLVEAGVVDVMVSVGSNFFYTVTLPCTLWFLDKGKQSLAPGDRPGDRHLEGAGHLDTGHLDTPRGRDTVLFLDARRIYRQVSRAHRDFTPEQIQFLSDVVRLYRGQPVAVEGRAIPVDGGWGAAETMADLFPDGRYADVPGLCKVATIEEIEEQGWSLNPGRYVGIVQGQAEDFDFYGRLEELNEELELLNTEAHLLEEKIAANVVKLFEGLDN